MKNILVFLFFLLGSNLVACCGCSLVSAGMDSLVGVVEGSVTTMDQALAQMFEMHGSEIEETASLNDIASKNQTILTEQNIKAFDEYTSNLEQKNSIINIRK
jgi:hypothetical protein